MDKLNKVIPGRVSDELWDKSIGELNRNPTRHGLGYKTGIIHLIDSVSRGYITPADAYDVLAADYIPELVFCRASKYAHLLQ